jgi:hypothetical protein
MDYSISVTAFLFLVLSLNINFMLNDSIKDESNIKLVLNYLQVIQLFTSYVWIILRTYVLDLDHESNDMSIGKKLYYKYHKLIKEFNNRAHINEILFYLTYFEYFIIILSLITTIISISCYLMKKYEKRINKENVVKIKQSLDKFLVNNEQRIQIEILTANQINERIERVLKSYEQLKLCDIELYKAYYAKCISLQKDKCYYIKTKNIYDIEHYPIIKYPATVKEKLKTDQERIYLKRCNFLDSIYKLISFNLKEMKRYQLNNLVIRLEYYKTYLDMIKTRSTEKDFRIKFNSNYDNYCRCQKYLNMKITQHSYNIKANMIKIDEITRIN